MASPAVKKKVTTEQHDRILAGVQLGFRNAAQTRYEKAIVFYKVQDKETQDALDRMIAVMCRIGRKRMWVRIGHDRESVDIEPDVMKMNMTYMVVEIVKDLGQFDIKVANFKFPEGLCAVCGSPKLAKSKKKGKS